MVNKSSAIRIRPFKFTKEQKDHLIISGWQLQADRAKAILFVAEAEPEIERWLTLAREEAASTNAKIQRETAKQIQTTALKLQNAINDMPCDMISRIDVALRSRTTRLHVYPQYSKATEYLRGASGQERANLFQMTEILNSLLDLLGETAGEVAAYKKPPGVNKGRERALILTLSTIYERCFKEQPSFENNSNFRNFLSELSSITGYEFGKESVKKSIRKSEI
ncbi:hypothetical protein [Nitrosomonas ureae]|uniref:hypothetical protein n=1 Tax=Nitrosomonas ureae TaxID=44577 RepID=UPI0011B217EE|nr:hypothetical protein [Nitrosomonas ureae]